MNFRPHIRYDRGDFPQVNHSVVIIAFVSCIMSISGMATGAQDTKDVLLAIGYGIATGGGIAAIWVFLYAAIASDITQFFRNLFMVVALVFIVVIFFASTQFNTLAFGSERALEAYGEASVTKMNNQTIKTYDRGQKLVGLQDDLQSTIISFEQTIKEESESGTISGTAGPGAVHSSLVRVRDRLVTAKGIVDQALIDLPEQEKSARRLIKEMLSVMNDPEPPDIRMDKLVVISTALSSVLSEMDVTSSVESVARQIESLNQETVIVSNFSKNPTIRANQEAALIKLTRYISATMAPVVDSITVFQANPLEPVEAISQISGDEAIYIMWSSIPRAWLAALAVDLIPIFPFILLFVSASSLTPAQDKLQRRLAQPIAYQIDQKQNEYLLRDFRPDSENLIASYDHHLGDLTTEKEVPPNGKTH